MEDTVSYCQSMCESYTRGIFDTYEYSDETGYLKAVGLSGDIVF